MKGTNYTVIAVNEIGMVRGISTKTKQELIDAMSAVIQ
jgi:hypothetical protein